MGGPAPMGGAPMMPPSAPQASAGQGFGGAFGGSVQSRQGFKQFMQNLRPPQMSPQIPTAGMSMGPQQMGPQGQMPQVGSGIGGVPPQMMGGLGPFLSR